MSYSQKLDIAKASYLTDKREEDGLCKFGERLILTKNIHTFSQGVLIPYWIWMLGVWSWGGPTGFLFVWGFWEVVFKLCHKWREQRRLHLLFLGAAVVELACVCLCVSLLPRAVGSPGKRCCEANPGVVTARPRCCCAAVGTRASSPLTLRLPR